MPIIHLSELKINLANLTSKYEDRSAFLDEFHHLLDTYQNRSKRVFRKQFLEYQISGNLTTTLIFQVVNELKPLLITNPPAGVNLINSLWEDGSFETRLLASHLLGTMNPSLCLETFWKIPDWLSSTSDTVIIESILDTSLKRIRVEDQAAFVGLLSHWFKSPSVSQQTLAFRAIKPLLHESTFEDIPTIFRIIKPAISSGGPQSLKEIQTCIFVLYEISPDETILFLNEVMEENQNPANNQFYKRVFQRITDKQNGSMLGAINHLGV